MGFREIPIDKLDFNFITALRDRFCLISATHDGVTNMLTAAWCQVGHVWQYPVATTYIRPSRYTKEFMDASGRFTMCFIDGHEDDVIYLGRHSGRDGDKLAQTGLHLVDYAGDPVYEEADVSLICRTLYVQQVDLECFLERSIVGIRYPEGNVSYEYIGEIEKVLVRE